MSLVLFSMLAYLYAFWCAYVLVMGIYRAHLSQRLVGLNKVLALPVVAGIRELIDGRPEHTDQPQQPAVSRS